MKIVLHEEYNSCCLIVILDHMGVSINGGTPKSFILMGFSIVNHPFGGIPIYGNLHMVMLCLGLKDIRLLQQLSLWRQAVRWDSLGISRANATFWAHTGGGSHQQHRNATRQTVGVQLVLLWLMIAMRKT